MHAIGPKVIASYDSGDTHIDFVKRTDGIFAACIAEGALVQYALCPLLTSIQGVFNFSFLDDCKDR